MSLSLMKISNLKRLVIEPLRHYFELLRQCSIVRRSGAGSLSGPGDAAHFDRQGFGSGRDEEIHFCLAY
jgi:hypothetical protein